MSKHNLYWILGIAAALYFVSKRQAQTGQEGNTTTAATGSNPFWTVGGAWYSQHFPAGAR